ncbi:MAG: DUF2189 domain-containing protein [Thiohalophilus sp.]|jgi:uncharacterized membrane protein
MQQSIDGDKSSEVPASVNKVDISEPMRWLEAGWQDFRQMPLQSGFYGLVFVLAGYALTAVAWKTPILVLTFVTGFFLVTPFLALGLYHLSWQKQQEGQIKLSNSLWALAENKLDMGILSGLHLLVFLAWIGMVSLISLHLLTTAELELSAYIEKLFTTPEGLVLLLMFIISGGLLALLVFVVSVVSWPMLMDRHCGIIRAVITSINVVRENTLVMILWAVLITGLLSIGLATFYLGLLVILPVLGHASWHAYRALVE